MYRLVCKGTDALAPLLLTMMYDLLVIKRLGVNSNVPSCVSRVLGLNIMQIRVLNIVDVRREFPPALNLWWCRIGEL